MSNNQTTNQTTTATSTSTVTTSQRNYFKWCQDHYKAIFTALAACVPILGAILSFLIYIYHKGYNSYFNINENWIDLSFTKSLFNLVYEGLLAAFVFSPNFISLHILLFNPKAEQRVKKNFWLIIITLIIVAIISGLVVLFTDIKLFICLKYALLVISSLFYIPIIYALICDIVAIIEVLIKNFRLSLQYLKNNFKFKKMLHPFRYFAKLTDKANEKIYSNITPMTNEEKTIFQNQGLMVLIVLCVFMAILFSFCAKYEGAFKAETQKNFSIISLNEEEYIFEDIKEYNNTGTKYPSAPYIKYDKQEMQKLIFTHKVNISDLLKAPPLKKRVVNAYVILTENDDNFLIANAFLQKNNNEYNLYIFSDEQTVIEKKDVKVKMISLKEPPELR